MNKGLDRLRIALGMGLLGSAVLAATRSAQAASAPASGVVVAGLATWDYENDTAGNSAPFNSCGGKGGRDANGKPLVVGGQPNGGSGTACAFGISEATLGAQDDAFDGALLMAVNGTVFVNPDTTVDLTGTTVTSDAVNIGGLSTQVQYYFDANNTAVRAVYSYTNTTGAGKIANVLIENNLGSDDNTQTTATSDGDLIVEPTDSWVTTDDLGPGNVRVVPNGGPTDPPLTFLRYSPGASVIPNVQPHNEFDEIRESYTLNIPANSTRRIMYIIKLNTTTPGAQAAGAALNSLPELQSAGLLSGLSAQQQSELANWTQVAVGQAAAIPSSSEWSKFGLMLTLGLGGLAAVRLGSRSKQRAG